MLETACLLLGLYHDHNVRNNFRDRLLRLLAEVLLPRGNNMPPSLYLLEKVVG